MDKKEYAPECAAWIKKTSKGDDYLAVKMANGTWVNLFKNNFKTNDKQPDWKEGKKKEDHNTNNEFGFEPKFDETSIPF